MITLMSKMCVYTFLWINIILVTSPPINKTPKKYLGQNSIIRHYGILPHGMPCQHHKIMNCNYSLKSCKSQYKFFNLILNDYIYIYIYHICIKNHQVVISTTIAKPWHHNIFATMVINMTMQLQLQLTKALVILLTSHKTQNVLQCPKHFAKEGQRFCIEGHMCTLKSSNQGAQRSQKRML